MQATFIGAQHAAGSFQDDKGKTVDFDRTKIYFVRPFRDGSKDFVGDKVIVERLQGNQLAFLASFAPGSLVNLFYDVDDGRAILTDIKPVK